MFSLLLVIVELLSAVNFALGLRLKLDYFLLRSNHALVSIELLVVRNQDRLDEMDVIWLLRFVLVGVQLMEFSVLSDARISHLGV